MVVKGKEKGASGRIITPFSMTHDSCREGSRDDIICGRPVPLLSSNSSRPMVKEDGREGEC